MGLLVFMLTMRSGELVLKLDFGSQSTTRADQYCTLKCFSSPSESAPASLHVRPENDRMIVSVVSDILITLTVDHSTSWIYRIR